jgi:SprT protein
VSRQDSEAKEILGKYLPDEAVPIIHHWIKQHPVQFKIVRPRNTKLGDYRPAVQGKPHRITVNANLNQYSFLITTVHEFAHFHDHHRNGRIKIPHGKSWKSIYVDLLEPFVLDSSIFPDDLNRGLVTHLNRPAASSCTDMHLMRLLKQYDERQPILLEHLMEGARFRIGNREFIKGELMRKRYLCIEVKSKRNYRVHALAEVEPVMK